MTMAGTVMGTPHYMSPEQLTGSPLDGRSDLFAVGAILFELVMGKAAFVSGKKQHGPEDKVGQDAGGNEGSKGQNVDSRRSTGTGKEPGDIGDNRGRSRAAE
jgi:serine/threonine protein kinase